jgi:hypothetical protein
VPCAYARTERARIRNTQRERGKEREMGNVFFLSLSFLPVIPFQLVWCHATRDRIGAREGERRFALLFGAIVSFGLWAFKTSGPAWVLLPDGEDRQK